MLCNVLIFSEGSVVKGFGHITRCTSIYQIFKKHGHDVVFMIDADNEAIKFANVDSVFCDWINDEKFVEGFPNKCIICLYHRFGYENGLLRDNRPEVHDCIDNNKKCVYG